MTAAVAAALAFAALPAEAHRRYRVEIGGEHAGWAELAVACAAGRCRASWASALVAPAEAGGATLERRIELETAPSGEALRVRAWQKDERGEREVEVGAGPAPASLAETLLAALAPGERRCLEVREEASGRTGLACARREGEWLEGTVLGEPERFRAKAGEPPDEVLLPAQRTRFAAEAAAGLPRRPPRLFGAEVRAAPGAGASGAPSFCGRAAEPAPGPLPGGVPAAFPSGATCREATARYLAAARRAGLEGRHVVGVAWDGNGFVWHEWAEVRVGSEWAPVDPSFRQAPARGPRFAVARYPAGDEGGRQEAGRAVLACWGAARVEAGPY
ncbi:MAG TPA: transglutaminase domain-containing protein [Anaeromyxobacteraceae bacterium]